jgi:hypothetical protein
MRGYMASYPIVQRFHTLEKTEQEFMKYELAKVVSVEGDLNHWSKRKHGTRSHSLEIYLFRGFASRGFSKL